MIYVYYIGSYERAARAAPIRSSSPLSFNGSRKSTPKTHLNKSYGRASNVLNEANVSKLGGTGGQANRRAANIAAKKANRLSASLDSLSVSSLHGSAGECVYVCVCVYICVCVWVCHHCTDTDWSITKPWSCSIIPPSLNTTPFHIHINNDTFSIIMTHLYHTQQGLSMCLPLNP